MLLSGGFDLHIHFVSCIKVLEMSESPIDWFRRDECRKNMVEDKLATFGWKF